MVMNFGQKVEERSNDIIPKNSLVWCVFALRGLKNSRETNGRYLDVELTVCEGQPYARRKIWTMIGDPYDANNKEEFRTMGTATIRRILEACKGANPQIPESYSLNAFEDLNGLVVPVLVTVQKGNKEYPDDKNGADFLSPYSGLKKIVESYKLLTEGKHFYGKEEAPAPAAQGNMFGTAPSAPPVGAPMFGNSTPQAAPAAQPGWLAPASAAQPPAQPPTQPQALPAAGAPVGFPQGQAPAQPQAVPYANPAAPQPPVQTNTAPAAPPAGGFPSNPAQPVGYPAQYPAQNTSGQ